MHLPAKLKNNLTVFLLYSICVSLFFFPILNNQFLSDDYDSLYRILIEKRILLHEEFFRPLMDISFLFNYFISGLHPWSCYLINLMLHLSCGFMLYKLASRFLLFDGDRQWLFAFLSGLLFLIYPFHSEGVAWLTGRLSSIATLCALVALYWSMNITHQWRYFCAGAIVFFIALLGYESIILLPLIIFVWNFRMQRPRNKLIQLLIAWLAVVVLCLIVRRVFSTTLTGDYGSRLFTNVFSLEELLKIIKVTGRIFLPPVANTKLATIFFIAGLAIFIAIQFILFKKKYSDKYKVQLYACLLLSFIISIALPCAFGISTKTSAGDRLLYFPSAFFCMILAFYLLKWARGISLWVFMLGIGGYFAYFLVMNTMHWEKASQVVKNLLLTAASSQQQEQVFINIPGDFEGAFVFANGFKKALVIHGIDTTKVHVAGTLSRELYEQLPPVLHPQHNGDTITIMPGYKVYKKGNSVIIDNNLSKKMWSITGKPAIHYWNKQELKELVLP